MAPNKGARLREVPVSGLPGSRRFECSKNLIVVKILYNRAENKYLKIQYIRSFHLN